MSNQQGSLFQEFWLKNGQKILIFLALLLVSLASYQAGKTAEKNRQTSQIKVSLTRPEASNPQKDRQALVEKVAGTSQAGNNQVQTTSSQEENCAFVGSKNSNKYHLPACRYAANIKPENKRCFSSAQEAEKSGYVPAGCCAGKK